MTVLNLKKTIKTILLLTTIFQYGQLFAMDSDSLEDPAALKKAMMDYSQLEDPAALKKAMMDYSQLEDPEALKKALLSFHEIDDTRNQETYEINVKESSIKITIKLMKLLGADALLSHYSTNYIFSLTKGQLELLESQNLDFITEIKPYDIRIITVFHQD